MDSLEPKAEYGCIAFDIFALEEWDYSRPRYADAEQWSMLVQKYLALQPRERTRYHKVACESRERARSRGRIREQDHPLLTQDNIARVLQPHQTIQERNICANRWGLATPVWVRTCYEPALEDEYEDLKEDWACEGDGLLGACPEEYFLLEDAALYDAGPDYDRDHIVRTIVTRLPSLGDFYPYPHKLERKEEELEELKGQEGEVSNYKLVAASCKAEAVLYVLDAEAIRENLIKLMWLDGNGNRIWNNKIEPSSMEGMRATFSDGYTLLEATETHCVIGNEESEQ
ncbi:hypothetical protein CDV31_008120 [Fusarium ambrosium]|uniref:Uncharacterized protein n=1 Tax=Fusarium ambrosium TaxID=131363 RepID=A0A428U2F2_9HYPO|nr:hypothetical protein CDV31_008120 [Fusarium ambrosium]